MAERRGIGAVIPAQKIEIVPFERLSILLFGEPKIGKTSEAAKLENVIFLDMEQGTLTLNVPTFESLIGRDRLTHPINKWTDVLAATDVLLKLKDVDGTIVIDPFQNVWSLCRAHVLDRLGINHETDMQHGKGWRAVKDEFNGWFDKLKNSHYGIIMIAHDQEVEVTTKTKKYTRRIPYLDSGARQTVIGYADLILYAHTRSFPKVGEMRVVQTKADEFALAGERGDPIRLPAYVPFSFDALKAQWQKGLDTNQV